MLVHEQNLVVDDAGCAQRTFEGNATDHPRFIADTNDRVASRGGYNNEAFWREMQKDGRLRLGGHPKPAINRHLKTGH